MMSWGMYIPIDDGTRQMWLRDAYFIATEILNCPRMIGDRIYIEELE